MCGEVIFVEGMHYPQHPPWCLSFRRLARIDWSNPCHSVFTLNSKVPEVIVRIVHDEEIATLAMTARRHMWRNAYHVGVVTISLLCPDSSVSEHRERPFQSVSKSDGGQYLRQLRLWL